MLPVTGSTTAPGRSAEFKTGATTGSPYSLQATSNAFNQQSSDAARRPHSVMDLYFNIRSPQNGNSDADAQRQTPNGQLPSKNDGYSDSTYNQLNPNFSHTINTN
jgi:hypothetical protein